MKTISEQSENQLISIILPTYNGEEFVGEAIESVLKQNYENYELIIVDDGSIDNTPDIIHEYSKSSKIQVFIHENNIGQAKNCNFGLNQARGTFVKLLGQDDVLMPTYLSEVHSIFQRNNQVSLVCSFEKSIGKSGKIRALNEIPAIGELSGFQVQKHLLNNGNWVGGPTATMFRKETLDSVGVFNPDMKCSLDLDLWFRILSQGNLYVIPKILYSCRVHSKQESNICFKKLGFIKDKIKILHNIEHKRSNYGRLYTTLKRSTSETLMKRLIIKSVTSDSKSVTLKDSLIFLKKFYSWSALLKILLIVLIIQFTRKAKTFIASSNQHKEDEDSPVNDLVNDSDGNREIELSKDISTLTWTRSGAIIEKIEDTIYYKLITKKMEEDEEFDKENFLHRYRNGFFNDFKASGLPLGRQIALNGWVLDNFENTKISNHLSTPLAIYAKNDRVVILSRIEQVILSLINDETSLVCKLIEYDAKFFGGIISTDERVKLLN
jgi:glycosyltransferase involved in cell wall biosynthesis